jgi:hypothetical protein
MSTNHFSRNKIHGKIQNGVFYKTVSGSIHRLRKPLAWALDVGDVCEAERQRVDRIEIYDRETGITYNSTLENFQAHALKVDRGYGRQLALEVRHWSYTAPLRTGADSAKPSEALPRPPRQLGLFEGVKYGR